MEKSVKTIKTCQTNQYNKLGKCDFKIKLCEMYETHFASRTRRGQPRGNMFFAHSHSHLPGAAATCLEPQPPARSHSHLPGATATCLEPQPPAGNHCHLLGAAAGRSWERCEALRPANKWPAQTQLLTTF